MFDFVDTDSDNDSCPDAIEGAGSFVTTDLATNDALTDGTDVNADGVPLEAAGGQGTTGAVTDATDATACCDIAITSVTATNEVCPNANDGTITIVATCGSCTGDIEYSINGTDWQAANGSFTALADGSYTVQVRDANDNTCTTMSTTMIVAGTDTELPTITCPADVAVNADAGTCAATSVVLGTPTTDDNCGVASVTNDAPASFPLGSTTVTWTVTDDAGLTATCEQMVTITDAENPTITCPADVAANTDAGTCAATSVVLGTPTTDDNCGVASVTNDAPAIFPIGSTTVTWTVTDDAGLTTTCEQMVTVTDAENPTITCPTDVVVEADASDCTMATSVALGTPTTGDNCGVASVTNDAPASFPVGATTVTWTATDNAGLTATCTQLVTVTNMVGATCDDLDDCTENDVIQADCSCAGTAITTFDDPGTITFTDGLCGTAPTISLPAGYSCTYEFFDSQGVSLTTCNQTNPQTGLVTATYCLPLTDSANVGTVVFTVIDACGNTNSVDFIADYACYNCNADNGTLQSGN